MFCSFDKQPLILRLYGDAKIIHPRDEQWDACHELIPGFTGARQFYQMNIEMVQNSCGYAVPHYEFKNERQTLTNWAEKKGRSGVEEYWSEKNLSSIDGYDSNILKV